MRRDKRRHLGPRERYDVVLGKARTDITERTKPAVPGQSGSPYKYLSIAGDVGFSITLPIVLAFIFGSQLDARLATGHVITLVFVSVGIGLSLYSLSRRIQDIIRIK